MGRPVLSPLAQADLDDIWDYTERNWGAGQARTYILQIRHAVETIAAKPARGRPCPELRPGYRKYPCRSHVIFYRNTETGIEIVRILHERMDVERHIP